MKIFPARFLLVFGSSRVKLRGNMAMTGDEINALRLLLREELQAEFKPFRDEVGRRFDEMASHIDGLYQRDEKREQEYVSIREQIRRLERRFA